jgi:putative hydrolase of the HAD superfamily
MVLIFDLDDTLYPERSYVESGFHAVARHLHQRHGWTAQASFDTLVADLAQHGRGALFNRLLARHGITAQREVTDCIKAYRQHQPVIQLAPLGELTIQRLRTPPYLVTDGHKGVQARKVQALGLAPRLAKVYITHRYGVAHAKPSTHCFELIRQRERCNWADMAYVGDNPAKDFVNLTPLGVHTVRVRTGEHAQVVAKPGYEARFVIDDLSGLPKVLPQADWR